PVPTEANRSLRLQEISTLLIQEGNLDALYERVVEAAIGVMSSDMGSMQTFHPEHNELRLLACRGFHPDSAAFWERVVNRRPILTPYRRPILTPLSDGFWR